jgi:hypothetical protein
MVESTTRQMYGSYKDTPFIRYFNYNRMFCLSLWISFQYLSISLSVRLGVLVSHITLSYAKSILMLLIFYQYIYMLTMGTDYT